MLDDTMFMDQLMMEQSERIGLINLLVIDYSKNLMKVAQSYKEVGSAGRSWLKSMNMEEILKAQLKAINKHQGIFMEVYGSMLDSLITLGKNFKSLGTSDFSSITSDLKMLDYSFDQLKNTVEEIKDPLSKSSMVLLLSLLESQIDLMSDMNKLQDIGNLKVLKYTIHLDKVAEHMEKIKEGTLNFIELLEEFGVIIPGIEKFFSAFDFNKISEGLKSIVSEGFMGKAIKDSMSGGEVEKAFDGISEGGTNAFSKMIKGGKKIFGGFFKSISKGFIVLFKGIASTAKAILMSSVIGIVLMIGSIIMAGIKRKAELQENLWNAQDQANALSGDGTNFASIYGAAGGLLRGFLNASELYSTMRSLKDVTKLTAQHIFSMERRFAVSNTTTALMVQNMKYVMGSSLQTALQMGVFVGKLAVAMKIQPLKMMKLLADLSSDVVGYFGKTTKHLIRSLAFSKKLNMSMDDLAQTAKGLDDTQKSIENSMKLQTLTGKKLDISEVLRLHNSGESLQAIAMMFDTYKDLILTGNRHVMGVMLLMFGLDSIQLKTAANSMKNENLSFTQALLLTGKLTEDITKDLVLVPKTAAAPLESQMLGTKRRLMDVFASITEPIFDLLQNTLPRLLKLVTKLAQSLEPIINLAFDLLMPVVDLVIDLVDTLFSSGLMEALSLILGQLTSLIQMLVDALSPVLNQVMGVFVRVTEKLLNAVGVLLTSLMPVLERIINMVMAILLPYIDKLYTLILQIVDVVINLFIQLMPTVDVLLKILDQLLVALMPIITVTMLIFSALMKAVGDLLISLLPILTPVLNLVTMILNSLMPIVQVLLNILTTVLSLLTPILKLAITLIDAILKPLMPIIEILVNLLNLVLVILKPIIDIVTISLNNSMNLIGFTIDYLVKFLTFSLGGITAIIKWVGNLATKIFNFYLRVIQPVVDYVTTIINGMVTMVKKIFSSGDFKANLSEAFDSFNKLVMDAFLNLLVSIWSAFKDTFNNITRILGNIFNVFKNTLKNILPANIFDGVINIFKKFVNFLSGLGDWIYETLINIPIIGSRIKKFLDAIKEKEQEKKENNKKDSSTPQSVAPSQTSIAALQPPTNTVFNTTPATYDSPGGFTTQHTSQGTINTPSQKTNEKPIDIYITLELDKLVLSKAIIKTAAPVG